MSLPDVIDGVRPSVVQITCTVFDLTDEQLRELGMKAVWSKPLGTGFFVNDEAYVVTAQHVIDGARQVGAAFPANATVHVGVGLAYPNTEDMRANFNVTGFDIVAEDERHDIAILKMRRDPFQGEAAPGNRARHEPRDHRLVVVGDRR